jgi:hypothetical protein
VWPEAGQEALIDNTSGVQLQWTLTGMVFTSLKGATDFHNGFIAT